jgi:hypothetical protein
MGAEFRLTSVDGGGWPIRTGYFRKLTLLMGKCSGRVIGMSTTKLSILGEGVPANIRRAVAHPDM